MSKILLVAAGAAGYVLGARAGRERYQQIAEQAQKVWTNPKVQQKRQRATDAAVAQAPVVKEKLADVTSTVTGKGSSSGGEHAQTQETTPAATQPLV
jgi:SLT domain-containing protein